MVPANLRSSHEATDEVLNHLDGLIAALDLVQDHLPLTDNTSPASMAFHAIAPMLREKMAELWGLRSAEWKAIGGN